MSKKKAPKKIDDVIGLERRTVRRSRTSLESLLEEEEAALVREARRLHLEEIVGERRRKVEKMKKETISGSGGAQGMQEEIKKLVISLITDPATQKQWIEMGDAQRNKILFVVSALRQSAGGSTQGIGGIIPLLMLQQQQNPGSSIEQMIKVAQLINPPGKQVDVIEAIKLGGTLAQKEGGTLRESLELIKPLYAQLSAKDKEQVDWYRSQITPLPEQLRHYSEMAGLMGYQKGGESLEIAKLQIGQDRWKTEQTWAHERWQAEMGLKKLTETGRMETLRQIAGVWSPKVGPLVDSFIAAGKKRVDTLGETTGGPTKPVTETPVSVPQHMEPPKTFILVCRNEKCNENITVKFVDDKQGLPDEVVCPKCNTVHTHQV